MTYTALSPEGPRIALAISEDLFHWQRLGLATFRPYHGIEFDGVDNKDASVFPVAIPDPDRDSRRWPSSTGRSFPGLVRRRRCATRLPRRWISIERASGFPTVHWARLGDEPYHLRHFGLHHRLASPVAPWERLKIGGGTPPILTRHGWMVIYHGVHELAEPSTATHKLCYSAGVLILSEEHPRVIRYRSLEPVLTPELPAGTYRDRRQRRVSHRHRPPRRSRLARPIRRLLRDGRQPDRSGASRRAEILAAGAPADPSGTNDSLFTDGQAQTESRQRVPITI